MGGWKRTWIFICRLLVGGIVGLMFVIFVELLVRFNIFQILEENPTARRGLGATLGALLGLYFGRILSLDSSGLAPRLEGQDVPTPEQKKLLAEAGKLERESLPPKWYFRWGPLVSGFAGLAVVGTLLYSLLTLQEQRLARNEDRFKAAAEALGNKEPAMRVIGANMVSRFLEEQRFNEEAISLLTQLFVLEESQDVVHALRVGLIKAGGKHPQVLLKDISEIKEGIRSKIIHTFSQKGGSLHRINLLQEKLYILAHLEKNLSNRQLALVRPNFQCWRRLEADFEGADLPDSIFWRSDLYRANFSKANLNGSLFMKSNLSYVRFSGADLKGADFRGAKVFNARFEGAKNIQLDLFKDASWAWAHFDPGTKERLQEKFGKEAGRNDLRKEGLKECGA